jgi:ATP synthase protein I
VFVPSLAINKEVYRIIFVQLAIIFGLAAVLLLFKGLQGGFSALMGGLAYWIPTFVFVVRIFGRATVRGAKRFMVEFVTGEAIKLFLSGIFFVLIVKYLPVDMLSVLIGFIGAVVAFWISSMSLLANDQEVGHG